MNISASSLAAGERFWWSDTLEDLQRTRGGEGGWGAEKCVVQYAGKPLCSNISSVEVGDGRGTIDEPEA